MKKIHLPSLLILILLGLSAAVLFLLSLFSGGVSIYNFVTEQSAAASEMISAAVLGVEALIILLCAWFVLQKTMGWEKADAPFRFPFADWHIFLVFGLVVPSIVIGGIIAYAEITWLALLALPPLTILVIAPPVWLLLGISSADIDLGARWRFFGILGVGMTLSPLIMIALELILLVIFLIIGAVFIAMQPALMEEVLNLRVLLESGASQDLLLESIAPYLVKPGMIFALMSYIAVFVPLIEELFKPLAVWMFAKSLDTPAQGFALGALSGAAFGLIESFNASADGSASWGLIVTVRAGTTLLHIAASGLVGWGIASAFKEKKILRLAGAYFSAVVIHGIWNACALGAGISSIGYLVGKPHWALTIIPAAIGGMMVLGVGMFAILIVANKKLRSKSTL